VSGARRRKPPEPLDAARAWDYALWLLGRQSYSATEIERRLLRRKLPAADAERVVARLIELQLLDDERFATSFVRSRKTAKGPLALRSMLRQRGVSDDVVHAALEAEGEVDQVGAATALLARQAWRFEGATSDDRDQALRARARAMAFLARRGFEPDTVHAALERAWGDLD
jgi:regulatory protein